MRHLGTAYKGKYKECLYPGNKNPEESYQIDLIMEDHSDILGDLFFMTKDHTEQQVDDAIRDKWVPYFEKIEAQLAGNKNSPMNLVGKSMTIADIAVGSYVMRFCHNPALKYGPKFKTALEQFPKVTAWSNMMNMVFKDWMAAQPPRPF